MSFPRALLSSFLLVVALAPLAPLGQAATAPAAPALAEPALETVSRIRAADLQRRAEALDAMGDSAGAARKWEEAAAIETGGGYPSTQARQNALWSWIDAGNGPEARRIHTATPHLGLTGAGIATVHYAAGDGPRTHEVARASLATADYVLLKPEIERGIVDRTRGRVYRLGLAHLLLLADQAGRAYRMLQLLVRAEPKSAAAWHYLADAATRLGYDEEAERAYARHAALAPASARAAITRARKLEAGKQPERAVAVLEAARKGFPDDEYLLVALMSVEETRGGGGRVAALLREALEPPLVREYGPPFMTHSLGAAGLVRLARWADLEAFSAEVMQRWPRNELARRHRLRALLLLDRPEEALRVEEAGVRDNFPAGRHPIPAHRQIEGAPLWLVRLAAGDKEAARAALPTQPAVPPGQVIISGTGAETESIRAWLSPPGPEREASLKSSALAVRPWWWGVSKTGPGYFAPDTPVAAPEGLQIPLKLWQRVAARYPECVPAQAFTAFWLLRTGSPARGLELLRKAVVAAPEWVLPRIMLAEEYRAAREELRAMTEESRIAEQLIDYHPYPYGPTFYPVPAADADDRRTYRAALELVRAEKWEEAARHLAAIRHPQSRPAAARLLAAVLLRQGQTAEAQ
ncbi:MAG TPA: hypothetical protein VK689_17240, partial [Armatimonadota bacterium]|nr:hypothetical protein [Armatimonadota bacterium]